MIRTQTRETYTVGEVAQMLGISRGTAYEAVRSGQIASVRIGRRLLVPVSTIQRLLGDASKEIK